MKVCMVAGIFPPEIGGPATQSFHLCQVLKRHGIEPFVVTFGPRTVVESYHGIKVYRRRLAYPGGALGKLFRLLVFSIGFARIVRRERPQVVHCHDAHPHALVAGAIARFLRVPSVVKLAGDPVYEKVNARDMKAGSIASAHRSSLRSRVLLKIERWGLRRFDVVWAASEFRRKNVVEDLRIDPGKVRVIPNYIRLPSPESPVAAAVVAPCPFSMLSAGRFAPHKRLDRTLEAVAALGQPDVRLRLVGGGDQREERQVDALVRRLGLESRVERLGKVAYAELISLMRSSDVLLSTSEEEGFGIVFVEAMAVGLPVVAMRIGAVPEVVPDGKAGFLVEPGDTRRLVECLELLARDPALRETMGSYGREHAQRYDLERHWAAFADLYAELVQKRSVRSTRRDRASGSPAKSGPGEQRG